MLSAKVISVKKVSATLWRIELEAFEEIKAKPFTFAMVWVPRVDEIPLSISKVDGSKLYFVFRIRGEGTRALANLPPGSFVGLKAPLGKGFEPRAGERVLAVAGGVGIAPIPLLADYCLRVGCSVDIAWGARSGDELCDPRDLGIDAAARVYLASEDGKIGFRGTVLDLALELAKRNRYDKIVAVGPRQMLRAFCGMFDEIGAETYVSLETMVKCGLGLCGSCCVRPLPKLLCVDGPVFACRDVVKHLELSEG